MCAFLRVAWIAGMTFIRRKIIEGKAYLYEVENYRDPQTGKTKQRVKQYLGRDPEDKAKKAVKKLGHSTSAQPSRTTKQGCCCQPPPLSLGNTVRIEVYLDGELRDLIGVIVQGMTQVPACTYPRNGRVKHEVVQCPYDPPEAVSVKYEWAGRVEVVQMPKAKVRRI